MYFWMVLLLTRTRTKLAGQECEQRPVAPGQGWSFHLPVQYNELLAEQHVLRYQFLLTAGQIHGGTQGWSVLVGLCPQVKRLLG
jgi:hypothetical protein